jgi:uncharacterized protein (DUF2141 family)
MLMLLASAAPPAEVSLSIAGQRSQKGVLQICLTRDAKNFPNCVDDGQAIKRKVAATGSRFTFAGVPSGSYAIAVMHDENGNDRLDTVLGIPREGFGFSRNPPIRFEPPRFAASRFTVTSGETNERVVMKYLL